MTIKLTKYDRDTLFKEFDEFLEHKYSQIKKSNIPTSIFSRNLTPFETIVKYLKEDLSHSYASIARMLKKNRQVIWITYKRAKTKHPKHFINIDYEQIIPISKFSVDHLSIFEIIVQYLREELNLRFSEIAKMLKRDSRTIWTTYARYKKKNAK